MIKKVSEYMYEILQTVDVITIDDHNTLDVVMNESDEELRKELRSLMSNGYKYVTPNVKIGNSETFEHLPSETVVHNIEPRMPGSSGKYTIFFKNYEEAKEFQLIAGLSE